MGTKTYKDTGPEGHGDRRAQKHKDTGPEGHADRRAQRHIKTRGQKVMGTDGHQDI